MMRALPTRVVCARCDRTLARFGDTDAPDMANHDMAGRGVVFTTGQYSRRRVRSWLEHPPEGAPRLVADCACGAHIVAKTATIARRAEQGERVIAV